MKDLSNFLPKEVLVLADSSGLRQILVCGRWPNVESRE